MVGGVSASLLSCLGSSSVVSSGWGVVSAGFSGVVLGSWSDFTKSWSAWLRDVTGSDISFPFSVFRVILESSILITFAVMVVPLLLVHRRDSDVVVRPLEMSVRAIERDRDAALVLFLLFIVLCVILHYGYDNLILMVILLFFCGVGKVSECFSDEFFWFVVLVIDSHA